MASYKLDKGFLVSRTWASSLRMLPPQEFHRVFWELYDYQENEGADGPPPMHGDTAVDILLSLILPQIDNRLQGAQGGRSQTKTKTESDTPPVSPPDTPPVSPKLSKDKISQDEIREDNISGEESDTIPPKAEHPHRKFTPPTAEEVEAYSREAGFCVDAARFVDYYTSKGWTVGKSPMKDWKAAVRCWERSSAASPSPAPANQNAPLSGWDYIEAVAKGEIQ